MRRRKVRTYKGLHRENGMSRSKKALHARGRACTTLYKSHACKGMCLYLPQDVVQRVGSRGPQGEFARALCARLLPQLISTQHVEELLKLACEEAPLEENLLGSALELLVDAAAASPALFAGPTPQVGFSCSTVMEEQC